MYSIALYNGLHHGLHHLEGTMSDTRLKVQDFTPIAGIVKSVPLNSTSTPPELKVGDKVDIRPIYNDSLGDGIVIATMKDLGISFAIHLDHIALRIPL